MTAANNFDRCVGALLAAGLVVGTMVGADDAAAQASRAAKRDDYARARQAGAPMLAIVALGEQRVTIYDSGGKVLQSPVSTGAAGYETPAGIYSVVQKKEVHASNIYEDGNMPFMQRITWTGIALHAGVLPGQPASHGCVRLPLGFAERLFGLTDIGLRVMVVRDDIAPRDIDHPALFKPNPNRPELALAAEPSGSDRAGPARLDMSPMPGSARHLQVLKSIAAAKAQEADAAGRKAKEARLAAMRKGGEAAAAAKTARAGEANLAKAEQTLKAAERALETASTPDGTRQAEQAKEKALARIAEAQAQLESAKAQAQAKADAAARAAEDAMAAEAGWEAALETAEAAGRRTSPVSVFISRKTQRLYIRHGYRPVYEGPVTIRNADNPIGSFVFTALGYRSGGADVRWSVVSMYKYSDKAEPAPQPPRRRGDTRSADAIPADVVAAKVALDRISISKDALERISEVVLPGSSLIISDEGPSIETGKDTDFVVLMSGEPQGGIKTRRREPRLRDEDDDFWGGSRRGRGYFSFWN